MTKEEVEMEDWGGEEEVEWRLERREATEEEEEVEKLGLGV